jgi:HD-GYP domain-containing protein (c-di-GMP phosphodiesterase class II)
MTPRIGRFNRVRGRRDETLLAATVDALAGTLGLRDGHTGEHSDRVVVLALRIGRALGLAQASLRDLEYAARLHDIGKVGVPDAVLRKAGPLADDEWHVIRGHAEWGAELVAKIPGLETVARIVRHHHERFDGAGYPDGLARDEIPLLARVIAVADSYNAMTSDRPYRRAMSPDVAIKQLVNGRGSQFQAELVDAFLRVLERAPQPYRTGAASDFALESMQHPELAPPAPVLRAAVA